MRLTVWIVLLLGVTSCGTTKEVEDVSSEKEETLDRRPQPGVNFVKVDGQLEKEKSSVKQLFKVSDQQCTYVNVKGDTIISAETYQMCLTDTITYFGVFLTHDNQFVGVDANNQVLFEIFPYDNGPDYFSEGLMRIKLGEKVGYANEKGEVVIPPKYACAFPFENGRAKVALECTTTRHGEHTHVNSQQWMYIDKQGRVVED